MKICRFKYQNKDFWGIIDGKNVIPLKIAPYSEIKKTSLKIPFKKIKLLAPVCPGKIVLAGLNYLDHAREMKMSAPKEPIIFIKPATSVIGPSDVIIYPAEVHRLDYEAELAIVIKQTAKNVLVKDAGKYILGYTCLNDVTARDLQKKDGQWTRAKSFDTFCPIGPWIETELDFSGAEISLFLNNRIKQKSNTANFIFSIEELISFISRIMTLEPGDVVSTGTPPGIGSMQCGDTVEVMIERIGVLRNTVAKFHS